MVGEVRTYGLGVSAMRIGELSKASGVDVETIRYYEKKGLLAEPARSANGYRAYDAVYLERLAFIRHCRALDIPLADIRRLLAFVEQPTDDCGEIDRLIDMQLARVQARLRSMKVLEQQLLALRGQCDASHPTRECGILHELVAAAHSETCVCHEETLAVGPSASRSTKPR